MEYKALHEHFDKIVNIIFSLEPHWMMELLLFLCLLISALLLCLMLVAALIYKSSFLAMRYTKLWSNCVHGLVNVVINCCCMYSLHVYPTLLQESLAIYHVNDISVYLGRQTGGRGHWSKGRISRTRSLFWTKSDSLSLRKRSKL